MLSLDLRNVTRAERRLLLVQGISFLIFLGFSVRSRERSFELSMALLQGLTLVMTLARIRQRQTGITPATVITLNLRDTSLTEKRTS